MSKEDKPTINAKLLKFQTDIEAIKRDGRNPFLKREGGGIHTYATLFNILNEVTPILNACKLILTQPVKDNKVYTIITDSESGEQIESWLELPNGLNAQGMGSAITYYRRYTLCSLLGLQIEDDDDGHTATQQQASSNGNSSEKQWLNKYTDKSKTQVTETWNKVIASLHNGYTIEQVESKYKLSKELKSELETEIKNINNTAS